LDDGSTFNKFCIYSLYILISINTSWVCNIKHNKDGLKLSVPKEEKEKWGWGNLNLPFSGEKQGKGII
jgi:hypothetical protein